LYVWRAGQWRNYNYASGAFVPGASVTTGAPGSSVNIPVWMDYDGDGVKDYTVFTDTAGWKFYDDSGTLVKTIAHTYAAGDLPVPADYDGDGDEDPVKWRPVALGGTWYRYDYATGALVTPGISTGGMGTATTKIPVTMDYDGDGDDDWTVFTDTGWKFFNASGTLVKTINTSYTGGDLPVPADYNGDGTDEVVTWRYSTAGGGGATWYWYDFTTGLGVTANNVWTGALPNTLTVKLPAPLDYNSDGDIDRTVYTNTGWKFYNGSTLVKTINTGHTSGDLPLSKRQVP
jgi:hypothetical protein